MSDAESDAELATRLATQAGRGLVEVRARLVADGTHPWQVMDAGDTTSQRFISDELRRLRPDDAVLSEEGLEDPRRFTVDRVWIIDPLDGTREYGEHGRTDWAVHVALWARRRASSPAAVSLPAHGVTFATHPPPVVPEVRRDRPRLVTSRNRAPYAAAVVAQALDAEPVRLGSAGAKAMSVVNGETDIYVHDGGMYQWDSAAPVAVALAAGLHASRIDGSPLVYNHRDPWLPDLIVCRPEWAEPVLDGAVELKATRYEIDGPVATVWLHRPHRHNAWTGRMHAEYRWVLAQLAEDADVRVVVVTGTPPAFCVGADAEALAGHAERGGYDDGLPAELATPGYGVRPEFDHDFSFHFGLPYVLIAAVNGAAPASGWPWPCSATCGSSAPRRS